MKISKIIAILTVVILSFCVLSCANKGHNEEDGKQFEKSQTYDEVKKGVRLELKYDEATSQFFGVITNDSKNMIERARVEVHLSNGVELGPTTPKDLPAGEKMEVTLSAAGQDFETWSTHAEVGSNEHGHNGVEDHENGEKGEHGNRKEGKGEHEQRERGEHN